MILEVSLQIVEIGLLAWLVYRKPIVSTVNNLSSPVDCQHPLLQCNFQPTKPITASDIAAALQPNLPIPSIAIQQGTAICVQCKTHVARFENTEDGPVCANCKP